METRALAIAFFYAIGTGLGGIIGPLLFGHLIATHNRNMIMVAFLIGAGVMALGGVAELFLGVRAENTQLEDVAEPLTAEAAEGGYSDDGKSGGESRLTAGKRRWKARDERRRESTHNPRRRFRPGPGAALYSPGMLGTAVRSRSAPSAVLDHEVDTIAATVEASGSARACRSCTPHRSTALGARPLPRGSRRGPGRRPRRRLGRGRYGSTVNGAVNGRPGSRP